MSSFVVLLQLDPGPGQPATAPGGHRVRGQHAPVSGTRLGPRLGGRTRNPHLLRFFRH